MKFLYLGFFISIWVSQAFGFNEATFSYDHGALLQIIDEQAAPINKQEQSWSQNSSIESCNKIRIQQKKKYQVCIGNIFAQPNSPEPKSGLADFVVGVQKRTERLTVVEFDRGDKVKFRAKCTALNGSLISLPDGAKCKFTWKWK